MQHDPHMRHEIHHDDQGREVHVTPGRGQRRTVGRTPEELMALLRARSMVDQARWNGMYQSLLTGARTEEDVERARSLTDYAYAHAWHIENPQGLAG